MTKEQMLQGNPLFLPDCMKVRFYRFMNLPLILKYFRFRLSERLFYLKKTTTKKQTKLESQAVYVQAM